MTIPTPTGPTPIGPNETPAARCPLVTRRRFLIGLGATVATAACSGKSVTVFRQDTTTSTTGLSGVPGAASIPGTIPPGTFVTPANRTLVILEMGGGNDGLSTVVPHADSRYYDVRRSLAIEDPIDLDGEVGLHPALAGVAARYQAGTVAIVEGVGAPDPDLSHFLSMQRWWEGSATPSHTGWVGRYLDGSAGFDELLAGITVGPGPTQAMLGDASFVVNIADERGLGTEIPWWIDEPAELMAAWAGFAPVGVPAAELTPLQRAIANTVEAQRQLDAGLAPLRATLGEDEEMEFEDEEGGGAFERQLRLAASLITSGVGPRVIYLHGEGDFDTHENQVDGHGELMVGIDKGLDTFWTALEGAGLSERAVVMTTSEFGRRPEDNDGGTDHGTAASHLIMGPSIQGGRYGESPSLARLDPDGNLIHSLDYRSLYATVLDGWLGADHASVLNASYETLPVFRS